MKIKYLKADQLEANKQDVKNTCHIDKSMNENIPNY